MMGFGGQQAFAAQQMQAQMQAQQQAYAQYQAGGAGNAQAAFAAAWKQASQQAATGQGAGAGYGQQSQAQNSGEGIGNERNIQVSGCTHGTVGGIVRGTYTLAGENHGKATYRKDTQVNNLDVMLYFWDERDGSSFCGWWFGPKVGGDQVWAYHPSKNASTPPKNGWKVPYDGPVDPTFQIARAGQAGGQQYGGGRFVQSGGWTQANSQQEEAKKLQQMQNLKKLEEMRRLQQEEQRKRMESVRKMQEEQKAVLNLRKVLQKVRTTTPDLFPEHERELQEVQAHNIEACGAQKERMLQEVEQGLEAGRQRVGQIRETQARVKDLLAQLEELVASAEATAKGLKEEAEPFTSGKDLDMGEVEATARAVEEAGREAKEKMKACTEFIVSKGQEMKSADIPGQPPSEAKQALAKLLTRINETTRGNEATLNACKDTKEKAVVKSEAKKKLQKIDALFTKADTDKDGALSKMEVKKYAQSEFQFTLSNVAVENIFKVLVDEGEKNIRKERFQRLKVAIGIEREKVKDAERKTARLAREKELAKLKASLQEKVGDVEKEVAAAAELVEKVEGQANPLMGKAKTMQAVDMVVLADEVCEAIKEAKEEVARVKKEAGGLSEGVDSALGPFIASETKRLEDQMAKLDPRLTRASNMATRFREEARNKEADELYALEKRAVDLIKNHKRIHGWSSDESFADLDSNGDGKIDESEFLEFFTRCEKMAKEQFKIKPGEEEEELPELSEEDLQRAFKSLNDEGEDAISKEKFSNVVRTFMKVSKDTVVTNGISIKEGKTLRRLEVGEIVEILEGPTKEETVEVWRVKTKVMKDGLEGWTTIAGNQGTVFLEEGGNLFKVVKDTILTESFELDAGSAKDTTRKLKDTTRKLKEGEVVEVREWSRKEEKSGLMRMKCRAKSDGMTGWVTTIGNQGTVYLEVM